MRVVEVLSYLVRNHRRFRTSLLEEGSGGGGCGGEEEETRRHAGIQRAELRAS